MIPSDLDLGDECLLEDSAEYDEFCARAVENYLVNWYEVQNFGGPVKFPCYARAEVWGDTTYSARPRAFEPVFRYEEEEDE